MAKTVNEENIKRDVARILDCVNTLSPLSNKMVGDSQDMRVEYSVGEQLRHIKDAANEILGQIGAAGTIGSSRKSIKSSAERHNLPTLNFIRAFVKKLNDHCKEEFGDTDPEFTRKYGPLYQFKVRETGRMSNDGWGNEYPEYMIYDDQGSLDWFEDEFLPKWIDEELGKSGFYAEPVGSSRFVIAVE